MTIKKNMYVTIGTTLAKASELYGVPKSTLYDRVSGKVQHGARPGAAPYLNALEEEELETFLIRCADIGYPRTVDQVLALVQQMLDFKGRKQTVTAGWWRRFKERHPNVVLRSAASLSLVRSMATDIELLARYFDILETTLKDNGIFNNPSRIFNCDEKGLPLSPEGIKVVAKVGSKSVSCISGADTKTQITVLGCACANGTTIPPFIIFDRKTLSPEMTTGEIPGTIYGLSNKGWINSELFRDWFLQHFIPSVPSIRPLLLIMDGHSSHYCPDAIRMAAKERIVLFTLPPHTTHISQPLDRGCFAPLQACWKRVCHLFLSSNPGRVITRYDFSALFAESWRLAMTQKNVCSGFEVSGIYPFSRDKVLSKIPQQVNSVQSLSKETGLAYIPLYSPVRPPKQDILSPLSPPLHESTGNSLNRSSSEGDLSMQLVQRRATSISRFLHTPVHPSKLPTKSQKSCGKVLTSLQNQKIIYEKEEAKKKAAHEKEQRKILREEKAKAKEEARRRAVDEKEWRKNQGKGKKREKGEEQSSGKCMGVLKYHNISNNSSNSTKQIEYASITVQKMYFFNQ